MRKKANSGNSKTEATPDFNDTTLLWPTFTPFTKESPTISAADHDLPIICDLFAYHAFLIYSTYIISDLKQHRELAAFALRIEKEVWAFVEAMAKTAKKEHPGADWLAGYNPYEETQPGEVLPPRITRIKG